MLLRQYRRFRNRFNTDLPRYRTIARMVPVGSVLDFGCGRGHLGRMLQEKGCTVTGCDISPEQENCSFPTRKMDLNQPTVFADGEFETVVASDVLEHLDDPVAALREMERIASRNVVISVPNSKKFILYRLVPSLEDPNEWCGPHLHHWSRNTFPMPRMPLVELTYSTDLPELRFLNLLRLEALSQTIVMKFDAAGGRGGGEPAASGGVKN